jgi:predicted RNA-binding Zn-ribbon protein involved in translation (DUF1610 family)
MSLLNNWKHMDNHMMDFKWSQEIWLIIIFGFIIFLTLIMILLYFLRHTSDSMIKEKEIQTTTSKQKIPNAKTSNISYCPECGNELRDKTIKFCHYCGAKI